MLKIDLVLLGLLMEQPRHGYDIKQEIDQRDMKSWVGISTPSIYNGLARLERQGALEAHKEPGGQHGDRTVYTITNQGRSLFELNLQQAFTELEHPLFQILPVNGVRQSSRTNELHAVFIDENADSFSFNRIISMS